MDIGSLIAEFGFPIVIACGAGYFVFWVWRFITNKIDPELENMYLALIKCIDANRMLDNDMIRLQQKVNVVLEYRERENLLQDQEEKEALAEKKKND